MANATKNTDWDASVSQEPGTTNTYTFETAGKMVDRNISLQVAANGYDVVSKTADGLCPQLPDETTITKFLRQDGTWANLPITVRTLNKDEENIDTLYADGFYCIEGQMAGTFPNDSYYYSQLIVIRGNESDRVIQIIAGWNDDFPAYIRYGNIAYGIGSWTNWHKIMTDNMVETAEQNGTTTSLVTTGEKYTWNSKTSNTGTVTSVAVKMNNTTKGTVTTSGTIDLGTVLTAHQDISGKLDKNFTDSASKTFPYISYNGANIWIGSTATVAPHHEGALYLDAGYNTINKKGNATIYICVPNTANNNGNNYGVLHTGNFMKELNGYWGMTNPGHADNVWIRTTSQGIIPYAQATVSTATCQIGTSSWWFKEGYFTNLHSSTTYANNIYGGNNNKYSIRFGTESTSTDRYLIMQTDSNLVYYVNGAVRWNTGTSSRRFKHNIQDMTEERALKLLEMRPVTFDYNECIPCSTHNTNKAGFIAEEIEEVVDDLVIYEITEEGKEIPYNIEYQSITPYLVKLCQMQQKQIDDLTKRIEKLEK